MLYRYHVKPLSPLCTELMSDTLFGHFCWAVRYKEGEQYLTDLLASYDGQRSAPVLFSSAFLTGTLPRPTLGPLSRRQTAVFVAKHFGKDKSDKFNGLARIKKWNQQRHITVAQWNKLKDGYSTLALYEELATQKDAEHGQVVIPEIYQSNTINRLDGSALEGGGLFHRLKLWYNTTLDLYVEINQAELEPVVKWFLTDYLPATGFGADKSVGMGHLHIAQDSSFDSQSFAVNSPDARLSLSLAAFPDMAETDAFYRLKTKFGKLGGSYVTYSPTGGPPNPFKKPVLMYEPGAVFLTASPLNNRALLKDVHTDGTIRHCGIPVTLPFILKEASHE
jgi:CRISPR-associated protein Csm4